MASWGTWQGGTSLVAILASPKPLLAPSLLAETPQASTSSFTTRAFSRIPGRQQASGLAAEGGRINWGAVEKGCFADEDTEKAVTLLPMDSV